MALTYIYEEAAFASGWFSARTQEAWFDKDITSLNGAIIQLFYLEPGFVDDPAGDVIFPTAGLQVTVFPGLFDDEDIFFIPMSVRALDAPDKALKNEIIRVR